MEVTDLQKLIDRLVSMPKESEIVEFKENFHSKEEKVRACYQHACLKYVSNEKMTNQTLRDRFGIESQNYSVASRIIRETLTEKLVKEDDPESKSRKYAGYVPFWA